VSEYATSVIRLFPDHAESVLWFSEPVPYEQTRLDARLVDDLRAWDASYHAGLTPGHAWRSPGLETRFYAEAARLARRVADQVGDEFQVQHDTGDSARRVRGAGPARNPDAAAAFRQLANAAREQGDGTGRAAPDGHPLQWRA
jgi:hypothetical protein